MDRKRARLWVESWIDEFDGRPRIAAPLSCHVGGGAEHEGDEHADSECLRDEAATLQPGDECRRRRRRR